MIEVKNVNKSFKNQKVLDNVSIDFEDGEITGIVGHNGSGKTVLFKCICGLLFCDSGEIIVDGCTEIKYGTMIKDAGVIIENPAYLENENALKNLKYLYEINNKKDDNHLHEVLRQVGLDPTLKKKVKHYSLGMRQRLAIAQAIMEDPHILILDEPMNGLDKNGVAEMRALFLEEKKQGKTIILASHNKEDIDVLCDHVYEMEDGVLCQIR